MNTLYIQGTSIRFVGFSDISKQVFFSFRNSGLVISPEKMQISSQTSYQLENHKIEDSDLATRLIHFGFLQAHSFLKDPNGYYFCTYPALN